MYDVRQYVNLPVLKPEFQRLTVDPYLKTGSRQNHILWLNHRLDGQGITHRSNFDKIEKNDLYQDTYTNPIRGGIKRVYPRIESWSLEKETMKDLMRVFVDTAQVPNGSDILVQFQRITCTPGKPSEPCLENGNNDSIRNVAVVCLERMNIEGGSSQFKTASECFQTILAPGQMVVFRDSDLLHKVTEIISADGSNQGLHDVILISSYV